MTLDPELAPIVASLEAEMPGWHSLGVDRAREVEDELFSPESPPPVDHVAERSVPGPDGPLRVREYRSRDPWGTMVFFHGGGWVLGTLDSADDICRLLARRTGCRVYSVAYRLAPEHPFPAGVEDAVAAVEWAADAEETGTLLVAGSSAGGNLAAAATLRARDAGTDIDGQLLLYPITDRDFSTPSYRQHRGAPLLSRADMEWFWRLYLGDEDPSPLAAPLRADDLSGLPPATVVTAGHDVLHSEGLAYAGRLVAAGVPTTHLHYPTMSHGFLSLTDEVAVADRAMDEVAASIHQLR